MIQPRWAKGVPFFISGTLFLSGVFALIAPVPLAVINLQSGRVRALLALFTNAIVVFALGGKASGTLYLALVGVMALALPEVLRRKGNRGSIELRGLQLVGILLAVIGAGIYLAAHRVGAAPLAMVRSEVFGTLDAILSGLAHDSKQTLMGDLEPEEWKRMFWEELPSGLGISLLSFVWMNLVLVLLANPGKVRERLKLSPSFFSNWRLNDFLLIPLLASWVLVLLDVGPASVAAMNVAKVLLAVYAFQGLSILASLMDALGLIGWVRLPIYGASIFLMLPLLLAIGVFDQWFDFRAKFRQAS